jgi:hypothetical protein
MIEGWRVCICHAGYEVSSSGRVRNRVRGNILKSTLGSHGYPMVSLGRKIKRTVHSLVAEAFLGPCPPGQEVRHRDDERWNAALSNLEYGTRAQNVADMLSRGRQGNRTAAYYKGRERMGNEAIKRAAKKTLETRNRLYGPGHTRLGFAGIKYSKVP